MIKELIRETTSLSYYCSRKCKIRNIKVNIPTSKSLFFRQCLVINKVALAISREQKLSFLINSKIRKWLRNSHFSQIGSVYLSDLVYEFESYQESKRQNNLSESYFFLSHINLGLQNRKRKNFSHYSSTNLVLKMNYNTIISFIECLLLTHNDAINRPARGTF